MSDPGEITRILDRVAHGETNAHDDLYPKVYAELRKMAVHYTNTERADHSLQPTELVHEAYLRLVGQHQLEWTSRKHFYAVTAQAMRRVLADHARRRGAKKRGGAVRTERLDDSIRIAGQPPIDLLRLEEALHELESIDARKVRVVELLYFVGLTAEQTADILGISSRTVERDWRYARTWLFAKLGE